jgi:hypothetical protein
VNSQPGQVAPINAEPLDSDSRDAARFRYLLTDPAASRHLLSLLQQGQGTTTDFREMVDRILAGRTEARR